MFGNVGLGKKNPRKTRKKQEGALVDVDAKEPHSAPIPLSNKKHTYESQNRCTKMATLATTRLTCSLHHALFVGSSCFFHTAMRRHHPLYGALVSLPRTASPSRGDRRLVHNDSDSQQPLFLWCDKQFVCHIMDMMSHNFAVIAIEAEGPLKSVRLTFHSSLACS